MIRTSLLTALAVLSACGGAAPAPSSPSTPIPSNQGGVAVCRPASDASLDGPFDSVEQAPEVDSGGDPLQITVLAIAPGPVTVALRQVRSEESSASCMVTVETGDGVFVGDSFLCAADRSDEIVSTDQAAIAIDGAVATISFRNSYELIGTAPQVQTYSITCRLGSTLSCTDPPRIGGYY